MKPTVLQANIVFAGRVAPTLSPRPQKQPGSHRAGVAGCHRRLRPLARPAWPDHQPCVQCPEEWYQQEYPSTKPPLMSPSPLHPLHRW